MQMAERVGLPTLGLFNHLGCLTRTLGTIDGNRLFGGLSNRDGPPEKRKAAQAGPLNGFDAEYQCGDIYILNSTTRLVLQESGVSP